MCYCYKKLLVLVVLITTLFFAGCAYQNTDGTNKAILPVEAGIYVRAAAVSGEGEQRVGIGKNAVAEVVNAKSGFNEARVGIAEAESRVESETAITQSRRPARDLN